MQVNAGFVAWLSLVAVACSANVEDVRSRALAVGSGPGEIGVILSPNEECRGPATITPTSDGRLAILDKVNGKIVVVGNTGADDVSLPDDFIEPVDFVATTRGYVVANAFGEVLVIDGDGNVLAWTKADYNVESGDPRLIANSDLQFALEDLNGRRVSINFSRAETGELAIPELANAWTYNTREHEPTRVVIGTDAISGRLSTVTLTTNMSIVNARALWASEADGVLIAVQESRLLPEEASFMRLVNIDESGQAISEAFIGPAAFACDTWRPFTRLVDGTVVSLSFHKTGDVTLDVVPFESHGTAAPKELGNGPDANLILESDDIFTALERLNGTPSVTEILLSPISQAEILNRGSAALEMKWLLASKNFGHPDVQNRCEPTQSIWRRPARLNQLLNQEVVSVPYRWGGYVKTLESFQVQLSEGRLAGNDCTCRDTKCVYPKATGLDCSGFVSYAWGIGNYFTTASLPSINISRAIPWRDLAPGDIVNKPGSHVRLVETVSVGPAGQIVTVLESASNVSCGGVCRRSYAESDLRQRGFNPLRRLNLI